MKLCPLILFLVSLANAAFATPERTALIIAPDELADAWGEYASDLRKRGWPAEIVLMSEVAQLEAGRDLPEKLRLTINSKIDRSSDRQVAVILGGDSEDDGGLIPDRDTVHSNMWGFEEDIPTDIYYISPTSWDADGDGVYGEWKDDREALSYPDGSVTIGRIPVRSVADVERYRAKITRWLAVEDGDATLTMTCAVATANAKVRKFAKETLPAAWGEKSADLYFSHPGDDDKDLEQALHSDLLQAEMRGKRSNWHIHGHGLHDRWILEHSKDFSFGEVDGLANPDSPLLITTVSCFTGQFDRPADPCLTEAMLRSANGTVAIIAPARTGKPHFHDPEADFPLMVREGKPDGTTNTMAQFWLGYLARNESIGLAFAQAKASMADDARKSSTYHQCLCEINLLGDPTLRRE